MLRPTNKGARCQQWQRVPGRGGKRLLRCAQFQYPRRRLQMGYRPGHTPANYGATCLRRKRVFSPWYNKKVWRCAEFGPGSRRSIVPSFIKRLTMGPRSGMGRKQLKGKSLTPGYLPPSLPSMERMRAGRGLRPRSTPLRPRRYPRR